jgi:alpha,alpha-trehalose phosphorylase
MRIYLNDYHVDTLEKAESLLFNGNGLIGIRGNLEEAYYDHFNTNRETYINVFYETKKISYPEKFHGFTETGETMISVVDGQTTLITIGDEKFHMDAGIISDSIRYLDMEAGQTIRELVWTSPKGRKTKIIIARLASFVYKNIFTMKYEFERLNHDETITLETHLNFYPVKTIDKNDPRMSHEIQQIEIVELCELQRYVHFKAPHSNLEGFCNWNFTYSGSLTSQSSKDKLSVRIDLSSKESTFIKTFSYGLDKQVTAGMELSFEEHQVLQREYLTTFWNTAKIEIEADDDLEESVNFGTYTLLSSLGTNGNTSIAAKGLSGSGYEGHYFWDSEMYIYPTFLHFAPTLAKQMLQFRMNTIEKARANREMVGYKKGILYPWRTISGVETSPFFEAGFAQHHINADIAYAFIRYYQSTGDTNLLFDGGYEVILETARLFADIGYEQQGKFHIDGVTGPDEYNVIVNDNYYTNVLVANQFNWVYQLADILRSTDEKRWHDLAQALILTQAELITLKRYADMMEKPCNTELGIIAQDRDFLNKEKWPFWDEGKFPLLLHYHPLVIYRYQVSKQADAVMALMLLPEVEKLDIIRRSVEYYDEVTTHDSSLSYAAFSIVYNRVGNLDKSYQYFMENARCDLDNLHGNTKDGLHTASMGGTMMCILYGFCDLRFEEDGFTLNPKLPKQIQKIKLKIVYKGDVYRITVRDGSYEIAKVS